MDTSKLKQLNELKHKLDELDAFLSYSSTVTIRLFGKKLNFLRKHTCNQVSYDIPKELYADVMNVLWKYLGRLNKDFEDFGKVE